MMDGMAHMMGMGWGMGLIGLLVALVLILLAAALIKYLFFRLQRPRMKATMGRLRQRGSAACASTSVSSPSGILFGKLFTFPSTRSGPRAPCASRRSPSFIARSAIS